MAFSFEPFLAISAGHFMAVLSEPEQFEGGANEKDTSLGR